MRPCSGSGSSEVLTDTPSSYRLVTLASPAIGNEGFCRMLDTYARPAGGLRIWNEFDVVPSIAQLVGFRHAGVPIKLEVGRVGYRIYILSAWVRWVTVGRQTVAHAVWPGASHVMVCETGLRVRKGPL